MSLTPYLVKTSSLYVLRACRGEVLPRNNQGHVRSHDVRSLRKPCVTYAHQDMTYLCCVRRRTSGAALLKPRD